MRIVTDYNDREHVYLDISDLEFDGKDQLTQEDLRYYVAQYNTKKKKSDGDAATSLDAALPPVNEFFETLSKDDQIKIARAYVTMRRIVTSFFEDRNMNHQQVYPMLRSVGAVLDKLDLEINLWPKIHAYVVEYIAIDMLENAGSRAQDKELTTFNKDEVTDLMTLTVLCKTMCIIYGMIMKYMKLCDIKDHQYHTATVLTPVVDRHMPILYDKLIAYLKWIIMSTIDKSYGREYRTEQMLSCVMCGLTTESSANIEYAFLLVRQMVGVDIKPVNRSNNLMTFIFSTTKETATTTYKKVNEHPTKPRILDQSENNTAQIEADSIQASISIDTLYIVKSSLPTIINTIIQKYDIDQSEYEKALAYYARHPFVPNELNKFVNAFVYDRYLGSGQCLLSLNAPEYVRLTALVQQLMFKVLPQPCMELAHLLTANYGIRSTTLSTMFVTESTSSKEYGDVCEIFNNSAYGTTTKQWNAFIGKIIESLRVNAFTYNTYQGYWDNTDQAITNGTTIQVTANSIRALCMFYKEYVHTGALT